MPFIQKSTPPPNKILNFSLRNFAGGLNNRSDQLEDHESPNVLNMIFADETLLEKRQGQTLFDDVHFEKPVVFIDELAK